jgi:hypothetical protein
MSYKILNATLSRQPVVSLRERASFLDRFRPEAAQLAVRRCARFLAIPALGFTRATIEKMQPETG